MSRPTPPFRFLLHPSGGHLHCQASPVGVAESSPTCSVVPPCGSSVLPPLQGLSRERCCFAGVSLAPWGLAPPPAYTVSPVSRAKILKDALMQGFRSPRGLAPPPAYTVSPVSRAKILKDAVLQGLRSPRGGLAPPPAYTVSPVSRAKILKDALMQGFRSPRGLAPPPA